MGNSCIEKHFPTLATRHEDLVNIGMSDRDAAIKAALEEYQKLSNDFNDFKKSISDKEIEELSPEEISPKEEKLVPSERGITKFPDVENAATAEELASLYDSEVQNLEGIPYKDQMIANVLGGQKVNPESFAKNDDKNSITGTIGRAWLAKKGRGVSLDSVAQEASETMTPGNPNSISPADVAEFIKNYPSMEAISQPSRNPKLKAIQEKHLALTGKGLNRSSKSIDTKIKTEKKKLEFLKTGRFQIKDEAKKAERQTEITKSEKKIKALESLQGKSINKNDEGQLIETDEQVADYIDKNPDIVEFLQDNISDGDGGINFQAALDMMDDKPDYYTVWPGGFTAKELPIIQKYLTKQLNEQASKQRADSPIPANPENQRPVSPEPDQRKAEGQVDPIGNRTPGSRDEQKPDSANADKSGGSKPGGNKGTGSDPVDGDLINEFKSVLVEKGFADKVAQANAEKLAKAIKDPVIAKQILYPENKNIRELWSKKTGVKLPGTVKGTIEEIDRFFMPEDDKQFGIAAKKASDMFGGLQGLANANPNDIYERIPEATPEMAEEIVILAKEELKARLKEADKPPIPAPKPDPVFAKEEVEGVNETEKKATPKTPTQKLTEALNPKGEAAPQETATDRIKKRASELKAKEEEAKQNEPEKPLAAREIPQDRPDFHLDIDLKKAEGAYRGISFDSDKRGKQELKYYTDWMNSAWDELSPLATNPDQKKIFEEEFERIRQGVKQRTNDYLSAKSSTMSPMITGPARFPVASNNKKLETERKRSLELSDYKERSIEGLKKKIKNAESVEQKAQTKNEEIEKLITQIREDLMYVVQVYQDEKDGKPNRSSPGFLKKSVSVKLMNLAVKQDPEAAESLIKEVDQEMTKRGIKSTLFAKNNQVFKVIAQAKEKKSQPKEGTSSQEETNLYE